MEKKYYSFEKEVYAAGCRKLDNRTIHELWAGFCFSAGKLILSEDRQVPFGFKTGEADYPALQQGKEFTLEVTEKGVGLIAIEAEELIFLNQFLILVRFGLKLSDHSVQAFTLGTQPFKDLTCKNDKEWYRRKVSEYRKNESFRHAESCYNTVRYRSSQLYYRHHGHEKCNDSCFQENRIENIPFAVEKT